VKPPYRISFDRCIPVNQADIFIITETRIAEPGLPQIHLANRIVRQRTHGIPKWDKIRASFSRKKASFFHD